MKEFLSNGQSKEKNSQIVKEAYTMFFHENGFKIENDRRILLSKVE